MSPAAPTFFGLCTLETVFFLACFLDLLVAAAAKRPAVKKPDDDAIKTMSAQSGFRRTERRRSLNQLPRILISHFHFVSFRRAVDEFEMKIVNHRRNSHELTLVSLTRLVDFIAQKRIQAILFPAGTASFRPRQLHFGHRDA